MTSEGLGPEHTVTTCENLRALANAYRDDGKYTIAGALYRRAIFLVDSVSNYQERYFFLKQILDDQAALLRKMKCGRSFPTI